MFLSRHVMRLLRHTNVRCRVLSYGHSVSRLSQVIWRLMAVESAVFAALIAISDTIICIYLVRHNNGAALAS